METFYSLSKDYIIKGFPKQGIYKLYNINNGLIFNLHPDFFVYLKKYKENPIIYNDDIFKSELGKQVFIETSSKNNIQFNISEFNYHYIECVMVHLLDECNNNCRHCYVDADYYNKELEISLDKFDTLLCKLKDYGVFSINLSGGEIGIVKNLEDILSLIVNHGFYIQGLFTNGSLLNHINAIAKLPQKTTIYVSIDGFNILTHDDFRCHSGSFQMAIELIKTLKTKSNHRVAINTILHKKNNNADELYELVSSLNPYSWRIETPFCSDRWLQSSNYALNIEDTINTYIKIIAKWLHDGEPFELEIGQLFRSQSSKFGLKKFALDESVCSYYENMLGIYANGEVTHCPAVKKTLNFGNIYNDTLSDIINNTKFLEYKSVRLNDIIQGPKFKECRECEILNICALGCRANVYNITGDYWGFDDYTCKQMKSGIAKLNQILKGTKYEYK